jgi:carbonic anhydrase
MSMLSEILEYNQGFVEREEYKEFKTSKYPDKKMVILTCMDTRLVELLPKAMNLRNGDAKIIKSAGAMVTHPFGSVMASIIIAIYALGAEEVFVIGHHDCGMINIETSEVLKKVEGYGINEERIDILKNAGINLDKWLKGFDSVENSIAASVKMIKSHPLMPESVAVHGLVIHPETGKLDEIINGYTVINK